MNTNYSVNTGLKLKVSVSGGHSSTRCVIIVCPCTNSPNLGALLVPLPPLRGFVK